MNRCGFLFAVVISCAIMAAVTSAKKKASPPKWKSTSMPYKNIRFDDALEGNSLKLDCKAQGHPKPSIKWMKEGVPIRKNTIKMSSRKFGLLLDNITADMSGNYTCLVSNKHGAIEWTFMLNVQPALWPLVVEGPKNITQMAGSDAAFTCRVLNDPKATIRWQRSHKKKGSKKSKKEFLDDGDHRGVLTLKNIQKEDEGQYFCMAGNIMGLKYSRAFLTVLEPAPTTPPPPMFGFDTDDNDNNKDSQNSYTVGTLNPNGLDGFGQPYDPQNPIFTFDNKYFTTTKRPRNKNKGGRGKNKNKKNKNKKNKLPKTRAPPPPTTTLPPPESSSTFWWTDDSTPSTPSTVDNFFDRYSTNRYFNDFETNDNSNEYEGVSGNGRHNTEFNPGQNGKMEPAKEDKGDNNDISEWKIYTIVGAVGGVVLLIGLIAITIAVCCPKQEGAVYKSTPV